MKQRDRERDDMALTRDGLRVRRMYDNWAERYEAEFIARYNYTAPREVFNAVAAAADIGRRGFRVLDVGVGTGLLSAHFRKANGAAFLTGVDISEEMLLKCKRKRVVDSLGQVNFQTDGLPFKDASFDAVVSSGVFELLKKPDLVIEEMARVVRPHGIVAFTSLLNDQDRGESLYGKIKGFFAASNNRPEDGIPHGRDFLLRALGHAGVSLVSEKTFSAYKRAANDTVYNLYIARKNP